jgi:uncharacterized DUF497 family protein
MRYEWDDAKARANLAKHDIPFEAVKEFDWSTAWLVEDERFDYGENRWLAIGMIGEQLHSLAFTLREERIRVISLRMAGRRERKLYDEQA